MQPESIDQYRQFHQQRHKRRLDALEEKRNRILSSEKTIANILKKNGASKALLFGSILNQKHFNSKSDLDLLAYDLPLSKWLPTLNEIEDIEIISDIEIDLKRAEELPDDFLFFTEKAGKQIL